MAGGFVGSPYFASPEQVDEGEIDTRSDIYSLGATLWFLLAGEPPFTGSLGQVLAQHLQRTPPLSESWKRAASPRPCWPCCAGCWRKFRTTVRPIPPRCAAKSPPVCARSEPPSQAGATTRRSRRPCKRRPATQHAPAPRHARHPYHGRRICWNHQAARHRSRRLFPQSASDLPVRMASTDSTVGPPHPPPPLFPLTFRVEATFDDWRPRGVAAVVAAQHRLHPLGEVVSWRGFWLAARSPSFCWALLGSRNTV